MQLRMRTVSTSARYRKHLYRHYLFCLVAVLGVLLFEMLFTSAPATSFLGESGMIFLVLLDLAALGYVAFLYISEDLEALHQSAEDLIPAHVQRQALESRRVFEAARQRSMNTSHSPHRVAPLPNSDLPILQNPRIMATAEKLRGITGKDSYAEEHLEAFKVEGNMRDWVERIRQYIAKTLIPMVLTAHVENVARLNQLLRLFTANRGQRWVYEGSFTFPLVKLTSEETEFCKRATLLEIKMLAIEVGCGSAADAQTSTSFSIAGAADQNSEAHRLQQARKEFTDCIRQRYALERFFEVPGFAARDYVVARLQALGSTSCLSGFSSYQGGTQQAGKWTAKSPTDSHIVANLWFAMLTNGNNPIADPAFQLVPPLVHSYPNAPPFANDPSKVFFYQKNPDERIEPHYDIISGKELWTGVRGQENVFTAIALFLVHVKAKSQGYFQQMSCKELLPLVREA
jgi:hypothetical protein